MICYQLQAKYEYGGIVDLMKDNPILKAHFQIISLPWLLPYNIHNNSIIPLISSFLTPVTLCAITFNLIYGPGYFRTILRTRCTLVNTILSFEVPPFASLLTCIVICCKIKRSMKHIAMETLPHLNNKSLW